MTVKNLIKDLKFAETIELKDENGDFLTIFHSDDTNKIKDLLDKEVYKWYPCFFETTFEDIATLVIMVYNQP